MGPENFKFAKSKAILERLMEEMEEAITNAPANKCGKSRQFFLN